MEKKKKTEKKKPKPPKEIWALDVRKNVDSWVPGECTCQTEGCKETLTLGTGAVWDASLSWEQANRQGTQLTGHLLGPVCDACTRAPSSSRTLLGEPQHALQGRRFAAPGARFSNVLDLHSVWIQSSKSSVIKWEQSHFSH